MRTALISVILELSPITFWKKLTHLQQQPSMGATHFVENKIENIDYFVE
jgi:hypothetical protein